MVRPPVVVARDMPIREAAAALRAENVSSALVGGAGAIVTERDFTVAWCEGFEGAEPVSAIAMLDPLVVDAGVSITEAASRMLNRDVRHLVVADRGTCTGVVSLRTIMAVMLQAAEPDIWLSELRVTMTPTSEFWLG